MADREVTRTLPKPSPQLLNSYLTFIVASGTVTLGFFPPLNAELRVWLAAFLSHTQHRDHVGFNAGL